jgi:hypothetical protein
VVIVDILPTAEVPGEIILPGMHGSKNGETNNCLLINYH